MARQSQKKSNVQARLEGRPYRLKRVVKPEPALARYRDAGGVHPGVLNATADELIAAGWGSYQRSRIPSDWRERRPHAG